MVKKILLGLLASLILFVSIFPNFAIARAATQGTPGGQNNSASSQTSGSVAPWYNQSFGDWFQKVYDNKNPSEIFGERYTAAQVQWIVYGLASFLINSVIGPKGGAIVACFFNTNALGAVTGTITQGIPPEIASCLGQIPGFIKGSVPGPSIAQGQQNLWTLVFSTDRPLSGISYVKNTLQNFSLVPVARAQTTAGFGFDALGPIQGIWKVFRDISFGLFVIVAVVFAFMIMFRVKLSPQTVISVQSALPKIIVALVLVTFSYAIAGFLVDLMYVVIGLLALAGYQIYKTALPLAGIVLDFFNKGPAVFFSFLTLGQPFGAIGLNISAGILGLLFYYSTIFFLPIFVLLLIIGLPILAVPGGAGAILYGVFAALLFIVMIIIVLWMWIKIIWSLVKAFANIVLLTIFAPIQIALGTVIPSLGFGQWFRSYVSNLAVFVVTGALFLFAYLFAIMGIVIGFKTMAVGAVSYFINPVFGAFALSQTAFKSPPAWPPLLGTGSEAFTGLIYIAVSFVLFTLMPKANEIIQGLLSGKPFAYGTAIGEAFGGVGFLYGQTLGPGVEQYRRTEMEERVRKMQKTLSDLVRGVIPEKKAGN